MKNKVMKVIAEGYPFAEKLCRYMYENPETGKKEQKASAAMTKLLRQYGYEIEYPYMAQELGYNTAFRATLRNGSGPRVAFIAEYDALPEIGHGCGHNLHGSLSVLSGMAMASLREAFQGTVYVIGTPAEETEGAKLIMAKNGVFDELDLAVMLHSIGGGRCCAEMDVLSLRCCEYIFHGKAAHAASAPWEGRNALTALRMFLALVDARRESFTRDVVMSYCVSEGGAATNIIPERAAARLEFRTKARSGLEQVDRIVQLCAEGAAHALECRVEHKKLYREDFFDMVRVKALEEEMTNLFAEHELKSMPVREANGSSDMGNVSYHCPSIQGMLSITDKRCALHTPEFCEATVLPEGMEAMKAGAAILAELALKVLNDGEFRKKIRESYETALRQKEGKS